jgi:hypothetical protein
MEVITYKDYIIEPESNTRFTLKKKRIMPPTDKNKMQEYVVEDVMGNSMSMSACISKIILDLSLEQMDDDVELAKFRLDFLMVEKEVTNVLGR